MASKLAVYDTGFGDERFEQIVSETLHCIICTNVIKDPVMCKRNEHLFCRACITVHLMNFPTCPTCMEPLTVETLSQAPRSIRNLLAELKIRCEFFDRGCGKFVQLGDLERHVADCGFAPAVCSNEGCQLEVNKQDLLHHETAVCELRLVKCHSCNDIRQEMDTVKDNLAMANEKLDRNEARLLVILERIEKNEKAVENAVSKGIELIRQTLKQELNITKEDVKEMKKSLKEITKLLVHEDPQKKEIEETKSNANTKSTDSSDVHQIPRSFLNPGGKQAELPGTAPKVNKTSVVSHVPFEAIQRPVLPFQPSHIGTHLTPQTYTPNFYHPPSITSSEHWATQPFSLPWQPMPMTLPSNQEPSLKDTKDTSTKPRSQRRRSRK